MNKLIIEKYLKQIKNKRQILSPAQNQNNLKKRIMDLKNQNNFNINKFKQNFWDFSLNEYKNFNKDLYFLNDEEHIIHFYYIGRYERRIYNAKIKILIVCDPWINNNTSFASGGNTALYNLGKIINERNYKNIYAKMYVFERRNIQNPLCNVFANNYEINPRTLVIYSDGMQGNPLLARNVMRWILLEIGTSYRPLDIVKTWGSNDLVYHWEKSKIAKNLKILNATLVDNIYINKHLTRKHNSSCYIIKKRALYNWDKKIIHSKNSFCIDELSSDIIVNIFNTYKFFYCYDLTTFLIIGAIICGCKVILVPDEKTKEEYINLSIFENFKKINNMFAWGEKDLCNINYDENDVNDLIKFINSLSKTIDIFLEDIYCHFNSIPENIPRVKNVYNS